MGPPSLPQTGQDCRLTGHPPDRRHTHSTTQPSMSSSEETFASIGSLVPT